MLSTFRVPKVGVVLLLAAGAAGCGATSDVVVADGAVVGTDAVEGGVTAPGLSVGAAAALVTVSPAPPGGDPAQSLFGPWTMARAGDRVCTIDLGSRNAVGDYTAKTRRCTSVELARIALWTSTRGDLVLYDFERRPVAVLTRTAPDFYEGTIAGEVRVTLWR